MTLTYWTAESLVDDNCYSIRTKTRREAVAIRGTGEGYGPVTKVVVEYENAFDLLTKCLDEGSLIEERIAQSGVNRKQPNMASLSFG